MANSGKSQQPGGDITSFSRKMNRVMEIAAAWRGEVLPTTVRLVAGEETELGVIPVTVGGNTLGFRGGTLTFYLKPGDHLLTLGLDGQEITEVNGEAPADPLVLTAGEDYTIEVTDVVPTPPGDEG